MALDAAKKDRKALANRIGCSVQAIGMVITAKSDKALNTLASAQAARFLDVDHYWLVTGEGEMHADGCEPPFERNEVLHLARHLLTVDEAKLQAVLILLGIKRT